MLKKLVFIIFLTSSFLLKAEELRLPFEGYWFVAAAGDTTNVNHHMFEPSQFFGVDFAKVKGRDDRRLYLRDGRHLEDYFSFGQRVYSPIGGEVISVENSLADNPIGTYDKKSPFGNYVGIKTDKGQYLFLAHFKKLSLGVKVGDKVKIGDPLGLCGNSGNSDYPHIHLHLQDSSIPYKGYGLEMEFRQINVDLSGKRFEGVTWPLISGLFVEPTNEVLKK